MEYEIKKLKAENYDGLLNILNTAFGRDPKDGFDAVLPAMWERDDEHMSKHRAIEIDGSLAAVTGIYPFKTMICGQEVTFATIGNVATSPSHQGKGLMSRIMSYCVEDAKQMGIDVGRLGGQRQRYNRFGFENAGFTYIHTLTAKNVKEYFGSISKEKLENTFTFKRITFEDTALLEYCMKLHQSSNMYVDRLNLKRFYKTLSAWKKQTFVAFDGDEPCGYICVSPEKNIITEHRAENPSMEFKMLCSWIVENGVDSLTIYSAPFEVKLNESLMKICEGTATNITSHYHVFNWCKVLNALLKLKATYSPLPEGEFTLKIEGYGNITFRGGECALTEKEADLTLSHLDATRFLLGQMPTLSVFDVPEKCRAYVNAAFPLPLWWCDQDRV